MSAIKTLPAMPLVMNKRFSRIVLVLVGSAFLALFGLWSKRPSLDSDVLGGAAHFWAAPTTSSKEGDMNHPYYDFNTTSRFSPVSMDIEKKTTKDLCASFPSYMTERIQPILKMGHSEKREKIESQLDSVSACFGPDELLIFSDMAETIRDRKVIDVIADLPDAYRLEHAAFASYTIQQEMLKNGTLDVDKKAMNAINGWTIDKYKFLPMVERAWQMRPGRDWYVFYETDTYMVWDNMYRFLSTLDPNVPLYMGSPSPGRWDKHERTTYFANGGPGFVLSRAAIEKLLHRRSNSAGLFLEPSIHEKYFELLKDDPCGDSVLGWALFNAGVPLSGFYPMFNVFPLHNIPYKEQFWCEPVLTLHKTHPDEMVKVWRWEHSRRKMASPLLYSDLFEFQHPGTPAILSDWDNGDLDKFSPPAEAKVDSFDTCGKACRNHSECVQWMWVGDDAKECILMRTIRFGWSRKPETKEEKPADGEVSAKPRTTTTSFKSGWVTSRIDDWRAKMTCKAPHWLGASVKRIH